MSLRRAEWEELWERTMDLQDALEDEMLAPATALTTLATAYVEFVKDKIQSVIGQMEGGDAAIRAAERDFRRRRRLADRR